LLERLKAEAPRYSEFLPQLPRLIQQALERPPQPEQHQALLHSLLQEQRRNSRLLGILVYGGGGLLVGILLARLFAILNYYF